MVQEEILSLIAPMMATIFAIVFLVMWKRWRMGLYVLAFAGAFFFFGLEFALARLLPATSPFLTWPVEQLFYSVGSALVVWGAANRVGQSVSLPIAGFIYGVSAVTLLLAIAMSNQVEARIYIANACYGLIFVHGVLALLQSHRRSGIDLLVVALLAVTATQFFVRPALTLLLVDDPTATGLHGTVYYSVLIVCLTIGLLAAGVILIGACAWDQVVAERERAKADELTGLRARRAFEHDALTLIERAKQEVVPISLVVADIDNFKSVNDIYGHQAGDHGIAAFGAVIAGMIRNSDIAGRIGGEEFCILAWNCDGTQAQAMAERIRRRFSGLPITGLPVDVRLTASFGVAAWADGEGYGKLFARADAELYRAKQSGRDRVCFDRPVAELTTVPKQEAVG